MQGVERLPQVLGEPVWPHTEVRMNTVGLPRPVVEELLPHLDAFQAALWVLYH